MTPAERHLLAASGYYELGLPLDALAELAELGPDHASRPEVLALRVAAFQSLALWEQMETAARALGEHRPNEAQWVISLAYAVRRARSLPEALAVLSAGLERFPDEPIVHYNLACYHAQLGNLDLARQRLDHAIRLEPNCREMARKDPDLLPLRDELTRPESGRPQP